MAQKTKATHTKAHLGAHFENPRSIQTDAQNAMGMVAGLGDLHRMTVVLSAENAPLRARLMVMRAAGGTELQSLAANQPKWQFVGVYPSRAMLHGPQQLWGL